MAVGCQGERVLTVQIDRTGGEIKRELCVVRLEQSTIAARRAGSASEQPTRAGIAKFGSSSMARLRYLSAAMNVSRRKL